MNESQTMILRFRDLVTEDGDTIEKHKAICDENGFVWWGWWNKSEETVPGNTFRAFNKRADSPLEVYLLDSGQKKVYKANCHEIEWDHNLERFKSPTPGNTPGYYVDKKCLAWFKFTKIEKEPCQPDILFDYSYTRVDEFFESRLSQFTDFYDKKICSVDELLQQDRSIWFIREFRDSDKTHSIQLLNSKKINPAHFPVEYIQTPSLNLLWVSDLHYSESWSNSKGKEESHHGFPMQIKERHHGVGNKMEFRLTDALENNGIQDIGGVMVSGDFTWKASKEEYDLSLPFFSLMRSWGKLDNYQFAVCPGNHDLAFSNTPYKAGAEIKKFSPEASDAYQEFYKELFFMKPNKYLSSGRKFLFGRAIPVDVCCLNSNFLNQDYKGKLFQGHGYIGEKQLQDAAKGMGWKKDVEPMAFRIVMLHHHLLPVTFREQPVAGRQYSVVLDAEALTRWVVEHRVRLVVHGHMHQPFWSKIGRPIEEKKKERKWFEFYVLGMGSTGVSKKHIWEIGKNTFGVLKFKKHSVNVVYYTIDSIHDPEKFYSLEIPYECEYKEY